jgi:two-component system response regulator PilR (NtrC family)
MAVFAKAEIPGAQAHRFRHTLATDILARGGTMADVADVLGISEHIARRHYAKWPAARRERISSIMRLVHTGEPAGAPTSQLQEHSPTVIQHHKSQGANCRGRWNQYDYSDTDATILGSQFLSLDRHMEDRRESGAVDGRTRIGRAARLEQRLAEMRERQSRNAARDTKREPRAEAPREVTPMSDATSEALIGDSPEISELRSLMQTAATVDVPVLISGERGTGKELVARIVHATSQRRAARFVSVSCAAFPETLEGELFGCVKGAFADANANRPGLFQSASNGTLFLDEIADLSIATQVKLLRALQERRIHPVGGNEDVPVDVRLMAASNRDLHRLIRDGAFREDLYYRISVIPIELPPLRQRREDIRPLALHFVRTFASVMRKSISGIDRMAMRCLERYDWPGNVRELENAIERAVALETQREVSMFVLPESVTQSVSAEEPDPLGDPRVDPLGLHLPESGFDLARQIAQIERRYIQLALERACGVGTKAAELLGLSYRSFRHYCKKYRL